MKQGLFVVFFWCTTFLAGTAQVPAYEYVRYEKGKHRPDVQLPDFTVTLKKAYKTEKAVHNKPSKMFVVSDIEGQYQAFKQLLQAAGVIDSNINWVFGKGSLVICGDVFDRGSEVTECLWLIYHLEEKAKKEGGYVHYILGNHEVMNLTGDLRYLHPKYLALAKEKGISYSSFYNKDTELGMWLRTKNVIEKIGGHLFLHGGVSQYINEQNLSIEPINRTTRAYYEQPEDAMSPLAKLLLFDEGPLWYRGYFNKPAATVQQVDSTLSLFRVSKIVIGHTPVDNISSYYGGRVINVDVPHAQGLSEGLKIDDKQYSRINLKGEQTNIVQK